MFSLVLLCLHGLCAAHADLRGSVRAASPLPHQRSVLTAELQPAAQSVQLSASIPTGSTAALGTPDRASLMEHLCSRRCILLVLLQMLKFDCFCPTACPNWPGLQDCPGVCSEHTFSLETLQMRSYQHCQAFPSAPTPPVITLQHCWEPRSHLTEFVSLRLSYQIPLCALGRLTGSSCGRTSHRHGFPECLSHSSAVF